MKTLILAATLAMTVALAGCAGDDIRRSTGELIDDTTIATTTKSRLLADSVTHGFDIDVEVDRGRVQLNGFVDSAAQRDRAGEIARDVGGVTTVENNLEVTEGSRMAGEYIDDRALQARVNAALAQGDFSDTWAIDVEVNRGIVSLGGFVDSEAAHLAALERTRGVEGVLRVNDNLAVR